MLASIGASAAAWMASQGVGLLLGFLGTLIKNWMDGQRAAAAQEQLGATRAANAVNAETAAAERRAAAVVPLDSAATVDALNKGAF
jgi:hypothetical protein